MKYYNVIVSCFVSLLSPYPRTPPPTPKCTGSKATGEWKDSSICIKTSTCERYKGKTKTGACPYDLDGVKCCIIDECSGSPEGLLNHSWCDWTGDSICNEFGRWLDSEYYPIGFFWGGKGGGES